MTTEDKVRTWARLARWDGDADAADAIEALLARAGQAEKERDETLRMWREYKVQKDADVARAETTANEAHAARERAEADNAALLNALRDAVNGLRDSRQRRCARVALSDHPGATLLERLRALEAVREAATSFIPLPSGSIAYPDPAVWRHMADACAAADALKERKP